MEFHEKLQILRKKKGITQEMLAEALYVSRTAVSKWESGRGYPSIDSLKAISKFYDVSIDELLSGDEVLNIAKEEQIQKEKRLRDFTFAMLDCSTVLFFFMPIFSQLSDGEIQAVSLLTLTSVQQYLKIAYIIVLIGMLLCGMITMGLQKFHCEFWKKHGKGVSLLLNSAALLLFIISRQPYAAILSFIFLSIKIWVLLKQRRHESYR